MPGRSRSVGIGLVVLAGVLAAANGLGKFDSMSEVGTADSGLLVPTVVLLLFVAGLTLTVTGEPAKSSA